MTPASFDGETNWTRKPLATAVTTAPVGSLVTFRMTEEHHHQQDKPPSAVKTDSVVRTPWCWLELNARMPTMYCVHGPMQDLGLSAHHNTGIANIPESACEDLSSAARACELTLHRHTLRHILGDTKRPRGERGAREQSSKVRVCIPQSIEQIVEAGQGEASYSGHTARTRW